MSFIYRHTPLQDSRSIRLLKLNPSAEPSGPAEVVELECQLIECKLDSLPTFSALSYTWEGQSPTVTMLCEGKELLITANCASALRRLLRDKELRLLWVDSICIDQSSIPERNCQVALMAEVFRNAEEVLIWLGDGSENAHKEIQQLKKMAAIAVNFPKIIEEEFRRLQRERYLRILELNPDMASTIFVVFPEGNLPYLHPMSTLCTRSWFDRIWTLQEIVLARKALVICGDESISWEMLDLVASTTAEAVASAGFTQHPGDQFQRIRVVSMLRCLLGLKGKLPTRISYRLPSDHPFGPLELSTTEVESSLGIAPNYFLASTLLTSDPKDKIYGLYAILQQYGIQLPLPDYDKPLAKLYEETTKTIMEHNHSLELLHFAFRPNKTPSLPSWVPDPMEDVSFWIPGYEFTSATLDSPARFTLHDDSTMSIYGKLVDTVKSRTCALSFDGAFALWGTAEDPGFYTMYSPVVRQMQEWVEFVCKPGNVEGDNVAAFCNTMLQELALAARREPKDWEKLCGHFADWMDVIGLPERNNENSYPSSARDTEKSLDPTVSDSNAEELDISQVEAIVEKIGQDEAIKVVHQMVTQRGNGNCMLVTNTGRLGVTHNGVEIGDQIFLCSGMRLPVLVRPDRGYNKFVGVIFLHGVMEGELWGNGQIDFVELRLI